MRSLLVLLVVGCASAPAQPMQPAPSPDRSLPDLVDACGKRDDATACRKIVLATILAHSQTTDPEKRQHLADAIIAAGTRGCHAGDFELCIDVAAIFHKGQAGPPDRGLGLELVGFACTRDYQPACVEQALVLANTPVEARDRERAGELLAAACAKDNADGCEMLATYRLSDGPSAATAAREAAQKSCKLGDPGGCAVYGHTLFDGIGGPIDAAGARTAFDTACRGKDQRGCTMVDYLARTPAQ